MQEMNTAEIMRRLARAAETGDDDAYWSLHSADFVAHIPGRSRVGGDHQGRSALEALNALEVELTEGTIEHEVHDSLVSEDHAVRLMHLRAARRGHDDLDVQVVYVFHVRDGKLVELWTHPFDQDKFDEFWN
jgi:ketosteroid isomerase-like protein